MSVHLHTRSCYTLLHSTCTIQSIISQAVAYQYKAVALTDKNVMHGAMSFYHEAKKMGIKPIFGLECDVKLNEQLFTFLLLAKDDIGYKQCIKCSSYLNTVNKIIDFNEFVPYTSHCFVLTAGENGVLEEWLLKEERIQIEEILTTFKENFQDFYVSLAMNDSGLLNIKNAYLKDICLNNQIKTTALSRIYYPEVADEESYRVLCAISQGVTLKDKTLNVSRGRHFRSQEEMAALYDEDDLITTEEIAKQCNVTMEFEKASMPHFQNKFQVSSEEYLKQLCFQGLKKRLDYHEIPAHYIERLNYELNVIISMKFADYFLIVYDFIRYARSQSIYVGPGRGSAPGSLVAYCLGITHLDPIKYNLLFERFLNPERISMPDIDTDFPDNRRDEVIRYVREKYGNKHVAHIVTFGTLAAKQVIRDVGKVLGIQPRDLDMLSKAIPNIPKVTLQYTYEHEPRFKQMIHVSKDFEHLYEIALKLEGLPRHASTHAGGILLCKQEIDEYCPLMEMEEGVSTTQFSMEYLEELGLIKMDFLGLRNLTIIDEIVSMINAEDANKHFDIMKIPLDDEKTFQCIQSVNTVGIFQLESEGMKNLIRQLQPENFEDIAATIALFRPGPMENIPAYLENRKNPLEIQYDHEDLIPILKDTYGIIIYQEQILQIAKLMAGFSLGKADILRKAMSKKKLSDLKSLQSEFILGATQKGYGKDVAQKVYDLILKFANYGFNRAHSVAYGLLAYQLAYLKANYPLPFFTSLLNSVIGGESKTSEYIFEAKKRKIKILSPCINHSAGEYLIEKEAIRYPLTGIKNIGIAVCSEIIAERQANGLFSDFFDFVARSSTRKINRKAIECLIDAGALDSFEEARASMKASLDEAIRYGDIVKVEDQNQITINFDLVSKPPMIQVNDSPQHRSLAEKEVLGFYLSNHPITNIREKIHFEGGSLIENRLKLGPCCLLGQVERVKPHKTKNGDTMAFVNLIDETSTFDLVVWPRLYKQHLDLLVKGKIIIVKGKIDKENSCLVNEIQLADHDEQLF